MVQVEGQADREGCVREAGLELILDRRMVFHNVVRRRHGLPGVPEHGEKGSQRSAG